MRRWGMLKRRKPQAEEEGALPEVAQEETIEVSRTTCYPQDADELPPVAGQPRTTVYRQAVRWNRGGYDATN